MTIAAFIQKTVLEAALAYHDMGFSIIPCQGKRPALAQWSQYQERRAEQNLVAEWFTPITERVKLNPPFVGNQGQGHQSIGVILGKVSQNLVVIDLDGQDAVQAFYGKFDCMIGATLTIATGSGKGRHLYFYADYLPENVNVRLVSGGGIEIRGNGQYVIAPPSQHEKTGLPYEAKGLREIAHIKVEGALDPVIAWLRAIRLTAQRSDQQAISAAAKPVTLNEQVTARKKAYLETVVSQELARVRTASKGNRNKSLYYAALRLANLCAGGELNATKMQYELYSVAASAEIPALEATRTIESAFRIGSKQPRTVK